jgi:hypothetical protein
MSVIPFGLAAGNPHLQPAAHSTLRPLDTPGLVARLADMADWARLSSPGDHADRLLLAAWSSYDDSRPSPRVLVYRRGVVVAGNRTWKVICINLSLTGALLRCRLPLADSGTITLNLRGLLGLRATIIEGGRLPRVRFGALSAAQECALGSFLGMRMASPRFIRELLS